MHWCDHRCVAPLNFIAMLRFDARRLGLTHDLSATGEVARALIAAGAHANGEQGDEETPLMTAASYGDADVARVLVEAGADLDVLAAPTSGGVPGGSALLHAAVFGMTDVLDVVVAHGARVRSIVEAAAAGDISGWPPADVTEQERVLALIMAADHERLAVIDELLAVGTPVDAVDETWRRQALTWPQGTGEQPASVTCSHTAPTRTSATTRAARRWIWPVMTLSRRSSGPPRGRRRTDSLDDLETGPQVRRFGCQ